MSQLETELAQRFGRGAAVVVGSGTAALYCAFEYLRQGRESEEPAVLFPDITCETAVHAAVFAGCTPRFCDVSPHDALIDAAAAGQALSAQLHLAAVPTHLYGHLADIDTLRRVAGRAVPLIEDAAQGYGGALAERAAGAMGDLSVISFGVGKLLDLGAGGALLCDDDAQAQACRHIASRLPADTSGAGAEREQLMGKMLAARKAHRSDRPALLRRQRQVLREHRNGYLNRCTPGDAARILQRLPLLHTTTLQRELLTRQLDDVVARVPGLRLPPRRGRQALWRYSFFVDDTDRRDAIAEQLQASGLQASKLFAPCSLKFAEEANPGPGSIRVAASVINLQFPTTLEAHRGTVEALKKVFS